MVGADSLEESFHLVVARVVANDRYSSAAGSRDFLGGLLDRMRELSHDRRTSLAAPGYVHRRPLRAECRRDATTSSPTCARDQRDPTFKKSDALKHDARTP